MSEWQHPLMRTNKVPSLIFFSSPFCKKTTTIIRIVLDVNGLFMALFLRHCSYLYWKVCGPFIKSTYIFVVVVSCSLSLSRPFSQELHFLVPCTCALIRFCIIFLVKWDALLSPSTDLFIYFDAFHLDFRSFPIVYIQVLLSSSFFSRFSILNTRLNGSYAGLRCTGHIIQYKRDDQQKEIDNNILVKELQFGWPNSKHLRFRISLYSNSEQQIFFSALIKLLKFQTNQIQ